MWIKLVYGNAILRVINVKIASSFGNDVRAHLVNDIKESQRQMQEETRSTIVQPLYNYCTTIVQLLCNHCTTIVQPLYN